MQHIARAHIEHPCSRCRGEGLRCYNNGSGWRGGVSFAKPTRYRGANRAAVSELAALLHKIDEGRVGRGARRGSAAPNEYELHCRYDEAKTRARAAQDAVLAAARSKGDDHG